MLSIVLHFLHPLTLVAEALSKSELNSLAGLLMNLSTLLHEEDSSARLAYKVLDTKSYVSSRDAW